MQYCLIAFVLIIRFLVKEKYFCDLGISCASQGVHKAFSNVQYIHKSISNKHDGFDWRGECIIYYNNIFTNNLIMVSDENILFERDNQKVKRA